MANSAEVSAGDDILASQYNNLRKDVLDLPTGHRHDGTDSRALPDGIITAVKLAIDSVIQGKVKTSVGSASGTIIKESGVSITMNEYCFFPNVGSAGNVAIRMTAQNEEAVYTGKFSLYNTSTTSDYAYSVYWRYIETS